MLKYVKALEGGGGPRQRLSGMHVCHGGGKIYSACLQYGEESSVVWDSGSCPLGLVWVPMESITGKWEV